MTRVATLPYQAILSNGIQRTQAELADDQRQLATGKRAATYADLGPVAVRNIAAHGVIDRLDAHADVAKHVGTTLALYDAHMSAIDTSVSDLRQSILTAVGGQRGEGLQAILEDSFAQFRSALNGEEAGQPLFAGGRLDAAPFVPKALAELADPALDAATAFQNDTLRASAAIGDQETMQYGVTAREMGGKLFEAFKAIANVGTVADGPMSEDQRAALVAAVGLLDEGLDELRDVQGANGRRQNRLDAVERASEARTILMKGVVGETEDADLSQVALRLAQHKTTLEASYSVFAQLSRLNLSQYLR